MPFFTGIGSPYWRPEAKAAILGITRDTNNSHLALACLEGIALSINDLLSAMEKDTALKIRSLKVDGGAVANNFLMDIQASISDTKIIRPKIIETTAFGAALASAIGAGLLTFDAINDIWKKDREFLPEVNLKNYLCKKKILWDEMVRKLYL
jgi:glycerol kinase